jgi:hypothetical protein
MHGRHNHKDTIGDTMLGKLFKKITGIDKIEAAQAEALRLVDDAKQQAAAATELAKESERLRAAAEIAAASAKEQEELAKLNPKERATRKKEPWVGVLETHVNKDNVRNGFFELDWNELFVLNLRQEGYGADGDKDEEVVDRWFRELCANVVVDGDFGGIVNTGSLDPAAIKKNL